LNRTIGVIVSHRKSMTMSRIAVIDPLEHRRSYIYDAAGREIVQIDANGNRTTQIYDLLAKPTIIIDGEGRRTSRSPLSGSPEHGIWQHRDSRQ